MLIQLQEQIFKNDLSYNYCNKQRIFSPNRYSCADHLKLHIQEGITPHKMIIHSKIPKVLTLAIQGQDSNKFTQKKYSWGLNVIEP